MDIDVMDVAILGLLLLVLIVLARYTTPVKDTVASGSFKWSITIIVRVCLVLMSVEVSRAMITKYVGLWMAILLHIIVIKNLCVL